MSQSAALYLERVYGIYPTSFYPTIKHKSVDCRHRHRQRVEFIHRACLRRRSNSLRSIWLHDLSRQLPDAQLDGFDISSEQYPAPGFLPSNISFRHLNILHDIPLEYVGKYDVVHARLLVQIINQADGDP